MDNNVHHTHLVKELAEQLEPLFKSSPQAIYLYLDDQHKICNEKFANMLGYKSVQEWVDNPYPVSDVTEADQNKIINAYVDASKNHVASQHEAEMETKNGKKLKAKVIFAPLSYRSETFVLHFIEAV